MCNHCSPDPRDRIGEAERALWGLRSLVNQISPNGDISSEGIGAIIGLIHDRLDGAATDISDYVPRNHPLAAD